MEMIGLVIIVILISIGMLFMAQFVLDPGSKREKIFTKGELAASTMSTLLKTTVYEDDCSRTYFGNEHPKFSEIIKDCAENQAYPEYTRYKCRGMNSCEYMKLFVKERLAQTLSKWGKSYQFSSELLYINDNEFTQIIAPVKNVDENGNEKGCPGKQNRQSSGLFPINVEGGNVQNSLFLCD